MNYLIRIFIILVLPIFSYSAFSYEVVLSSSCNKLKESRQNPFLLILARGDKLPDVLLNCMQKAGFKGAVFSGSVGALENVTLSYYDRDKHKKYLDKKFTGVFELLSLNGNFAWKPRSQPVLHLHTSVGKEDYSVIGGHLSSAIVGVTAEILVTPILAKAQREKVTGHPYLFLIKKSS